MNPDHWERLGYAPLEDWIARWRDGGERVLPLVSGGLDSAYVLWRLCEAVPTGDVIDAFHCRVRGPDAVLHRVQDAALAAQIAYLGGTARVRLHTAEISLPPGTAAFRDFFALPYIASGVARASKARAVVIGDDMHGRGGYAIRSPGTYNVLRGYRETLLGACGIDVCIHNDETDLVAAYRAMPEDFRALTWSCRAPEIKRTRPVACGECGTCKTHKDAGWRRPKPGFRVLGKG